MATLIKASGEEVHIEPENGNELSLQQLQSAVEGYIELAPILHPDYKGKIMFCNEDGYRLKKPLNIKATQISGDNIVGDVIVCDKSEVS